MTYEQWREELAHSPAEVDTEGTLMFEDWTEDRRTLLAEVARLEQEALDKQHVCTALHKADNERCMVLEAERDAHAAELADLQVAHNKALAALAKKWAWVEELEAFKASVDEALNSGDGSYRP